MDTDSVSNSLLSCLSSRQRCVMSGVTRFERQMEKALSENVEAMLGVAIGDSHRHALIKGERQGLTKALKLFRDDNPIDPDGDGI